MLLQSIHPPAMTLDADRRAHGQDDARVSEVTLSMPSRKEAGGALLIVIYEVPLLTEFPFHVMKRVELVQQEDKPLHVKVDRSCLFALDQWNEFFVGSAQDPDVTCPCCGKKQHQIRDQK